MAKQKYFYKVLYSADQCALWGNGSWKDPGVWNRDYKTIRMCVRGWHYFISLEQMRRWNRFSAAGSFREDYYRLWKIEVRGQQKHDHRKSVSSGARLVRPYSGKIVWAKWRYDWNGSYIKRIATFKNGYCVDSRTVKVKKRKKRT